MHAQHDVNSEGTNAARCLFAAARPFQIFVTPNDSITTALNGPLLANFRPIQGSSDFNHLPNQGDQVFLSFSISPHLLLSIVYFTPFSHSISPYLCTSSALHCTIKTTSSQNSINNTFVWLSNSSGRKLQMILSSNTFCFCLILFSSLRL